MTRNSRTVWRLIGHVVAYAIMGILLAVALVVAVGISVSGPQPSYSGIFTQAGCDFDGRTGCLPVGTSVSEDGSIVQHRIHLDGWSVGKGGTVGAIYTPTGFSNDAENNIVHLPVWAAARYWSPWALVGFFIGMIAYWARKWRRRVQS